MKIGRLVSRPKKLANMKKVAFLSSFFLVLSAKAEITLQGGDILLQPLNCRLCSLIESEEQSIYSHMGVVVQTQPEVLVAEAWFTVTAKPFAEFNKKTEKGQKLKLLRFRNDRITQDILNNADKLWTLFQQDFAGKKYDSAYLWNNFDENGNEMLYCSELVSKLYQAFLGLEMPIKRMHFSRNRDAWDVHFRGHTPVDQWGNSPADYDKSDLFYAVGEL